jgi:nucleoside 2-deoxyribosyltransferase
MPVFFRSKAKVVVTKERPKLYLAAPLFSEAEKDFNRSLRDRLRDHFDIFLPQDDGALLVDLVKSGLSESAARSTVFHNDIRAIESASVVLIVLDGRSVDEGAAFECGFAYALGKLCVGLQTDPRRLLPIGNNPMLSESLAAIFPNIDTLLEWATAYQRSSRLAKTSS